MNLTALFCSHQPKMRSQAFLVAFLSLIVGIHAYWLADISRKLKNSRYTLIVH